MSDWGNTYHPPHKRPLSPDNQARMEAQAARVYGYHWARLVFVATALAANDPLKSELMQHVKHIPWECLSPRLKQVWIDTARYACETATLTEEALRDPKL